MTKTIKKTPAETEALGNESTAIVAPQTQEVNFSTEALIARAIDQKVDVGTMERLLVMAKEMQAIKAKQEFDKAMANFQAECPAIKKDKEVKNDSGKILYKYAPIDSIISQVKSILQTNGFSYSTNMELLENGVKVFVKVTHIMGHSEVTEMNVPLGTKTGIMSASQQVAAAQTFAKRYAFLNAFGIMTGDEDTDARPQEEPAYNYQEKVKPFDDSEVLKMILVDLEACDTALEYELRSSDIKIARKNGKLSEESYKKVVEACKETVKRIQGSGLKKVDQYYPTTMTDVSGETVPIREPLAPGMQKMKDAMEKAKTK